MVAPLDLDQAVAAMEAANRLRVDTPTRIDLWSRHGFEGTVGLFESVQVRWSASGQASFVMRGSDPLAALVLSLIHI